jgi:arabinan endo-1,5-alpha-L-arabinosidase
VQKHNVGKNFSWAAISQVTDDAGTDWIVYHAISPAEPKLRNGATRRPALIDRITWVDGWPVVHDGAGPSSASLPIPAIEPIR